MQTGRQTDRQADRLAGKQPGVMDDLSQCERKGGMSCKIERARATCCREGGGRPPFLLTVIGKENARPRSLASRPCVWLAQVPRRPPYLGRRLRPRFPRLGVGGEGAQDLPGDGDRGPVRREILLPRRSRDPGMNVCYTQHLLTVVVFVVVVAHEKYPQGVSHPLFHQERVPFPAALTALTQKAACQVVAVALFCSPFPPLR